MPVATNTVELNTTGYAVDPATRLLVMPIYGYGNPFSGLDPVAQVNSLSAVAAKAPAISGSLLLVVLAIAAAFFLKVK